MRFVKTKFCQNDPTQQSHPFCSAEQIEFRPQTFLAGNTFEESQK